MDGEQKGENMDEPQQDKGSTRSAYRGPPSELDELRWRIARLEALLQALFTTLPTVMPQAALLSAAGAAACSAATAAPTTDAGPCALAADGHTYLPFATEHTAGQQQQHLPEELQLLLLHEQEQLKAAWTAEQLFRDQGEPLQPGGAMRTGHMPTAGCESNAPSGGGAAAAAAAATPGILADSAGGQETRLSVSVTAGVGAGGIGASQPSPSLSQLQDHGPEGALPFASPELPSPDPLPALAHSPALVPPPATAGSINAGGSGAGTRPDGNGSKAGYRSSTGAGAGSGAEVFGVGATEGLCVAMAATRVVMHQLVLPADVNTLGICTGGQVLSWIDLCAGLSAKTLAHGPCVTASVDAVHFLRPCRLGCVVIIAAMVSRTFNTSIEVAVVVESEDMRTGVRHHCCSAHLTFVVRPRTAMAAEGAEGGSGGSRAVAGVPRVCPTTPEHRAVWEGAEVRRQQRLERRTRVRRNPELRDAERICRLQPITHREGGPTLPPAVTLSRSPTRTLSGRPSLAEDARDKSAATVTGGSTAAAAATGRPSPPLPPPPPSLRQRVSPGCTTAYMTQSILPQHANTLSITFGGQVMSWVEQCAYISASRLRAPALLTAAMDSVSFVKPTRVGDILYITAQVTAIFGSSLEVMVSVFGESPYSGAGSSATTAAEAAVEATEEPPRGGGDGGGGGGIFHCADAFVTVVAVDERHGLPVTVPFELDPEEPPDLLRYQGAVARRAERLTLRGEFTAAECTRMSLDGSHTYSPPPEPATTAEDAAEGEGGDGGGGGVDAIPPL